MLHAITVINFRGESLYLELSYPERTGLMVFEVTGIGSGEADINVNEMATTDGASYNSSRLTTRNIVMKIKPMETDDSTVEENRHKTYRFFPTKKHLTLQFHTDSGVRCIEGYVEHNDPVIFSKQEYTQISILCPDPRFYDAEYTNMPLSGYISMFEFPFSNESLTKNLIQFDELKTDKRIKFFYSGEFDTGIIIRIIATGEVRKIAMMNTETAERMVIDTDKLPGELEPKLIASDIIQISTYLGKRGATLIRGGRKYNIINCLGRHSDWFTIYAGWNEFVYNAKFGENSIDVYFDYKNVYEGV